MPRVSRKLASPSAFVVHPTMSGLQAFHNRAPHLTGLVIIGLTLTLASYAQETDEEPSRELDKIVVTGYHIKRFGSDGPAPVVVFDQQNFDAAGVNTLSEFARYLPYNAPNSNRTFGNITGTSNFNLRGLGQDETLTLVNGRRVAPFAFAAGGGPENSGGTELFVDINAIPLAAIERIEILKDGASALYGSEAVAGVVNIILRKHYDGLEFDAAYLSTTEGDHDEATVSITGGWNSSDTSLVGTLSYFDRSPLHDRERPYLADLDFSARGGRAPGSPYSSPPTIFFTPSQSTFDPACPEEDLVAERHLFPTGEQCAFNFLQFTDHIVDSERVGGSFLAGHELGEAIALYGELLASRNEYKAEIAPTVLAPSPSVPFFFVPSYHPHNPFEQDIAILYRALDAGQRTSETESTSWRAVVGIEVATAGWDWDASVSWSRNEVDLLQRNYIRGPEFQNALCGLDGTGDFENDFQAAACGGLGGADAQTFYNPFGLNPVNPPELIEAVTTNTRSGAESGEWSADFLASTDFGLLPGGPIGMAFGAQYRQLELDEQFDPRRFTGEIVGLPPATEIHADRSVWAVFGEAGLPLAETVELQVAARYDHYDDFGGTTNPKIAALWKPRHWLAVRATYGTSFRAPAFRELFDPELLTVGFSYEDPLRCPVTGSNADCNGGIFFIESRGNPDLEPEEGESLLLGFEWTPATPQGLIVGIDFWRLNHEDRIIQASPQFIIENFPGNSDFITRAPPSEDDIVLGIPGPIERAFTPYFNADEIETEGFDVELQYPWSTDAGDDWNLGISYTHTSEYRFVEALAVESGTNFAGKFFGAPLPRDRANLTLDWSRGNHGAAAIVHYVGDFESNVNLIEGGFTDTGIPFIVDDWYTLDLQYRYSFEGLGGAELRLGCQNCTDEDPPLFNSLAVADSRLHDKRGAVVYLRWTQPFGK